jgi:plastocyanin
VAGGTFPTRPAPTREGSSPMRRAAATLAVVLSLAIAPAAQAATVGVAMQDNYFSPNPVTVAPGDTVNWTNRGRRDHTVTSTSIYRFDSGRKAPGGTFPKAFTAAGAFGYLCVFHSGMTGTVRVRMLATKIAARSWTLRVASATAPSGFQYQVFIKRPGASSFSLLRTVTSPTTRFDASVAGTHQFYSRLRRVSDGRTSGNSPVLSIAVS